MRKVKAIIISIMAAFLLVAPFNTAMAKEKINVYIFRGEGCPHCEEALQFFDKLSSDKEYGNFYNLKKYEVWYDEKNNALMEKVTKELKEKATGVPYIVIGKKTFSGYSSEMDEDIKKAIKSAYESDSYVDVVKKVDKSDKKENSTDILPIAITIGVAVIIIGGLVILAKKM